MKKMAMMMAKVKELQARSVEMVFTSRVKAERYFEEQDKKREWTLS